MIKSDGRNPNGANFSHFIIFRRTPGHCVTWLLSASSLYEALIQYSLHQFSGVEVRGDRSLAVEDGFGRQVIYEHPLACIEAEDKAVLNGSYRSGGNEDSTGAGSWNGWEVRRLPDQAWQEEFAEVFCSESPYDVAEYIALCRPLLKRRHPRHHTHARAFTWYLIQGPLITFYRITGRSNRSRRVEVLDRYHLPWSQWPRVEEWQGTYDDILEQMAIDYPVQ